MDIVKTVLEAEAKNEKSERSIKVQKDFVDIDEGTLLAADYNPFDVNLIRADPEEYVESLTRDNVQLLINRVWVLPTERVDEAIVAKLPKPSFILPRARAVPKLRAMTKWEEFAKEKGIRSKKKGKSKLKWDEQLRKWIPTFGYQKVKAQEQKDWLVELGDDNNPKRESDPRTSATIAKQERIAKNEVHRLKNIARSNNIVLPRVGLPSTEHFRDASQISNAVTIARASTASVGKFQSRLPKEKDAKEIASKVPGIKKKREALPLNFTEEKKRDKDVAYRVLSKQNKKNVIRDVPTPAMPLSSSVERTKLGKRKRSGAEDKKGKGGKKPKSVKSGARAGGRNAGGRKRRN